MPAELGLHRAGDRLDGQQEGGLLEGRDRLALGDRELAAAVLRARVERLLLRDRREVGTRAQLVVDLRRLGLRLDEDVSDLARLGRRVIRLVLRVVLVDVGRTHLDVLAHVVEELLGEDLGPNVDLERIEGVALTLELLRERRLVALEDVLLHLGDPLVDVLVGDRDLQLVGFALVLDPLDEVRDRLRLQGLVFGRAGLREFALVRLVGQLHPGGELVELLFRDLLAVDRGDGALRHIAAASATAGGEQDRDGGQEQSERANWLHEQVPCSWGPVAPGLRTVRIPFGLRQKQGRLRRPGAPPR